MQLPRFLSVPFELGRPLGAPDEPDFQRRVLRAALELFERDDGPVVLEDFPDDAPAHAQGEAPWACPVRFEATAPDRPALVAATLEEMGRLAPWHELYRERRGHAAAPASGIDAAEFVRLLGELAGGNEQPEVEVELPLHEWIRLGCDDLRTWYMEGAQGQPGRGSSSELRDWFWRDTAAARLIASAATQLREHPNTIVRALAARAMVPRQYLAGLPSSE